MNKESEEMIRNARSACASGEITEQQKRDVYFLVALSEAESELEA